MRITHQFLFLLCLAITASSSFALPRYALKRGEMNCSGCHLNPTGGGLRSAGGLSFEQSDMAMWKRGGEFSGQITPSITLGADFRNQFLSFAQTQGVYKNFDSTDPGGPGTRKVKDTTISTKTFQAMSYAIELGVEATKSLYGYFRYDPITPNPEMYALWHIVHSSGEVVQSGSVVNDLYVKFGAFLPAYGIRFDDHSVYTRGGNASISGFGGAGLLWTYAYRDVGAELGASLFDHASLSVGVFNGSETFSGANFSTQNPNLAIALRGNISGELVEDMISGEVGFSMYSHPLADPNGGTSASTLSLTGIHGGVRVGPVSVLAEFDAGTNVNLSNSTTYYPKADAMIAEGTVRIVKGLEALLRYESFENKDAAGVVQTQVKSRMTIGAQWFPLRFIEVRPEFRIAKVSVPNADLATSDDQTQTTFLTQIHLFF